jgi:hypothetical protein
MLTPMHSRGKKRWLAALLGVIAAALAFEGLLRLVLFADIPLTRSIGYRLRRARCYADYKSDEDYWKLALRFGEVERVPPGMYHPDLGWISDDIDRASLRHAHAGEMRVKRPILLFGDSFARCMTSREDCFEGLIERSDLGARYGLLNYAVNGYGLDQIHILIDRVLDLYVDLDPIVVVGIFVDDDLDRVAARIRNWPKPHYSLVHGALVPDATPVPTIEAFLAAHPVRIRSYAWRWLLHGSGLFSERMVARWTEDEELMHEKKELSGRILDEIERGLKARNLEHFYLVFQGEDHLAPDRPPDWRDHTLTEFFARTEAPFVSSAPYLLAAARARGVSPETFFASEGNRSGHYLPEGNAVVFEALRAGLAHRFESRPASDRAPDSSRR